MINSKECSLSKSITKIEKDKVGYITFTIDRSILDRLDKARYAHQNYKYASRVHLVRSIILEWLNTHEKQIACNIGGQDD